MPLVTRWGSKVQTVPPLEPGPDGPKPTAFGNRPKVERVPEVPPLVLIPIGKPRALGRLLAHPFVLADPPASGLDIANASVILAPASGLDVASASVIAPDSGLDVASASVIAPDSGLDIANASVILAPASGLDVASASVIAPNSGLDVDSTETPTLNIQIVPSSDFALDPSTGTEGEIKYSSEDEFIYIHNGTEWHRTNGIAL